MDDNKSSDGHQLMGVAVKSTQGTLKDRSFFPDWQDVEPEGGKVVAVVASKTKKSAKRSSWKKPDDKPKRGLSAYNLFFQLERERLVAGDPAKEYNAGDVERIAIASHVKAQTKRRHRKSHGKISFADLARTIANAWKKLDRAEKRVFDDYARIENARYRRELERWMDCQKKERESNPTTTTAAAATTTVALLTPSAQMTQTVTPTPYNNEAPHQVTSMMSTIAPVMTSVVHQAAPCSVNQTGQTDKNNKFHQLHPNSLEAILQQGDFLLQNPAQVSADLLKEQIRMLEQEYMRQAAMLLPTNSNNHQAAPLTTNESFPSAGVSDDTNTLQTFERRGVMETQHVMSMVDQSFGGTTTVDATVMRPDDRSTLDDPFEPRPMRTMDTMRQQQHQPSVAAANMTSCEEEEKLMMSLLESYEMAI